MAEQRGMTMGAMALILIAFTSPAAAEGFNLTQLLQADFKVRAAVPGTGGSPRSGPSERFDTLYLEGKLPGGTKNIVVRCVVRDDPEEGENNCWQVY